MTEQSRRLAEIRMLCSGGYITAGVVAIHSFLRHNPWFDGTVSIRCPADELDEARAAFAFLPQTVVRPVSIGLVARVESLFAGGPWVIERFWGLQLFEERSDGDVLILDADTCTVGSMEALRTEPGELLACGEGAAHMGVHVDRDTNEFVETASPSAIWRTFNSGMLRVAADLLGPELMAEIIEQIHHFDWGAVTRPQHDQLVLNRVFEGRWTELDPSHNLLLKHLDVIQQKWDVTIGQAQLLHFNEEPRPWRLRALPNVADPRHAVAIGRWLEAQAEVVRDRALADIAEA